MIERGYDRRAYLIPSAQDIECVLAGTIAQLPAVTTPIRGFGSSDCRCGSHLFLLEQESVEMFRVRMADRGARLVTINDIGPPAIEAGAP